MSHAHAHVPKRFVVITGSRRLEGIEAERAIRRAMAGADVLLHGGCPTGADEIAESIARELEMDSTVLRAKWSKVGRGAGPDRNERLALAALRLYQAGHSVKCVAFPMRNSRGTLDCIERMRAHGIPLEVRYIESPLS